MQSINFDGYVTDLAQALGLNDIERGKLLEILQKFTNGEKYKLIDNTREYVNKLSRIDEEIKQLTTGELAPYMESIKKNWDLMNQALAELQILSLIQRKGDNCDKLLDQLLKILGTKVSIVNEILKKNLEVKSSSETQKKTNEVISSVEKIKSSDTSQLQSISPQKKLEAVNKVQLSKPPSASPQKFQEAVKAVKAVNAVKGNMSAKNKYLKYKKKYLSLKKYIN
jgi:hypothetical protein